MASITKRKNKYLVQIRRTGHPALCKTFTHRRDAEVWGRQRELELERGDLPVDPRLKLKGITLSAPAWQRMSKRLGLDDLHFHDFRHEAISTLFERGLNTPEVASISGHKDWRMLAIYTNPKPADILKKLDVAA